MSRAVAWQRSVSDAVSWNQDQALSSTIYILREVGPTSFLLKEDGLVKKFKVSLGDPHSCNCSKFIKEREICKHICWILLKRFKLTRHDELSYQLGLVEREINGLLRGRANQQHKVFKTENISTDKDHNGRREIEQRTLSEADVCPICQEQLLAQHLPVTYCRYGCGNSVHIKCMKVYADHQRQSSGDSVILCPFCRDEFVGLAQLAHEYRNIINERKTTAVDRLDSHTGVTCRGCNMLPVKGKCYQCVTCVSFHLCNTCYHGRHHMHHAFVFRAKKSQRWRAAPSRDGGGQETLLGPVAHELQTRELNENDYELLLQLDGGSNNEVPVDLAGLPEHVVNRIPMMRVKRGSRLLAAGRQCRLCLRAYAVDQFVRRLPGCGHLFHRDCIDQWLTQDHRRCPIDRELVHVPVGRPTPSTHNVVAPPSGGDDISQLVIPGIGLVHVSSPCNAPRPQMSGKILKNRPSYPHHPPAVTLGELLVQADAIGLQRSTSDAGSIPQRLHPNPSFSTPNLQRSKKYSPKQKSRPGIKANSSPKPRSQSNLFAQVGELCVSGTHVDDRSELVTTNWNETSVGTTPSLSSPMSLEASHSNDIVTLTSPTIGGMRENLNRPKLIKHEKLVKKRNFSPKTCKRNKDNSGLPAIDGLSGYKI